MVLNFSSEQFIKLSDNCKVAVTLRDIVFALCSFEKFSTYSLSTESVLCDGRREKEGQCTFCAHC